MKKLTLLLVIGYLLVFSTSLVWGQPEAYTPAGYNAMLEAHKLKLTNPQKCPPDFVTVKEGQNIFGTTAIAYTPDQYKAMLEAYGVKISK